MSLGQKKFKQKPGYSIHHDNNNNNKMVRCGPQFLFSPPYPAHFVWNTLFVCHYHPQPQAQKAKLQMARDIFPGVIMTPV